MPKKRRARGQGQGTIFKRRDGRWVGALWVHGSKGKRTRKVFYGWTRDEVEDKLGETLHKRRHGFPIVTEKQTFGQFLDWWLTQCVKPSVRVRTFNSYGEQVRLHLTPAFGPIELTKLTAQQAQEFFNSQLETFSLRSVHYQRRVLRIALRKA